MRRARRWDHRTIIFVVGASLIALCIAARRLGVGAATDTSGPAWWLASMFLLGAALLVIVLVEKIVEIIRKP